MCVWISDVETECNSSQYTTNISLGRLLANAFAYKDSGEIKYVLPDMKTQLGEIITALGSDGELAGKLSSILSHLGDSQFYIDAIEEATNKSLHAMVTWLVIIGVFLIALAAMAIIYFVAQLWLGGKFCVKTTTQTKDYNYQVAES